MRKIKNIGYSEVSLHNINKLGRKVGEKGAVKVVCPFSGLR